MEFHALGSQGRKSKDRKNGKKGGKSSSREGGMKCGFGSTRLTAALRKKTALLFVNQASALAGKGHFSTQPPKCYAND